MLITISGLPGAGTSTVARSVATELGLQRLDGGAVFRGLAVERDLSLADFGRIAEADPAIDLELDRRLADRARAGDLVLESRLAGWIAANEGLDGVKVWLACTDEVRDARVAGRDGHSLGDAAAVNRAREASEAARYLAYYGIDIADLSVYDLVLDSAEADPDALVRAIVDRARA